MAGRTIDWQAILLGTLLPGSAGGRLAAAYRKHLFGPTTLQQIPSHPEFVFNATNLQSGALWRFSKPYLWDYRVGEVKSPTVELAVAVAASSAFPPFLSPVVLDLDNGAYEPGSGDEPGTSEQPSAPAVHDPRRARRRRRLRQPRARDRLEALHDGARLGRRRPHGRPAPPEAHLADAGLPRPRGDRQPGAEPAQATADRRLPRRPARGHVLGHPQRHRRLRPRELAPLPGGGHEGARRHLHPSRGPRSALRRNGSSTGATRSRTRPSGSGSRPTSSRRPASRTPASASAEASEGGACPVGPHRSSPTPPRSSTGATAGTGCRGRSACSP